MSGDPLGSPGLVSGSVGGAVDSVHLGPSGFPDSVLGSSLSQVSFMLASESSSPALEDLSSSDSI